jgi:hypothetical protein
VIGATIDSSVYIRALHFGGPAALLIGYARAGKIRIDISDPILNETLRVLRDKFGWSGICCTMRAASWRSSPTA